MQTFVPHGPDFALSAKSLDRLRLNKQRVETFQILRALTDPTYGWQNHPAVKMWRGYVPALSDYGLAMCVEWLDRGYNDNTDLMGRIAAFGIPTLPTLPAWLDDPAVQVSHRSNLIRKLPEHYAPLWPHTPDDLPYVWPSATSPDKVTP